MYKMEAALEDKWKNEEKIVPRRKGDMKFSVFLRSFFSKHERVVYIICKLLYTNASSRGYMTETKLQSKIVITESKHFGTYYLDSVRRPPASLLFTTGNFSSVTALFLRGQRISFRWRLVSV
jgi:hypothetical protein